LVVDLATESEKRGDVREVWRHQYQWLAAPTVVINRFDRLLADDPKFFVRCGCLGLVPPDIEKQFIARAKQALSTSVGDSITEE
jgi:hypothetical protein